MNKLLLSACLAGEAVRYDGDSKQQYNDQLQALMAANRVVAFCPETAGGLPVPRDPAEIKGGDGKQVLDKQARVITVNGYDVTGPFLDGAHRALEVCRQESITVAILTEKSPSCGSGLTYDGSFSGSLTTGDGVTAALLKKHGIRVFNQHQINEAISAFETTQESGHD